MPTKEYRAKLKRQGGKKWQDFKRKQRAQGRRYRKTHKAELTKKQLEWKKKNPKKYNAIARRWWKKRHRTLTRAGITPKSKCINGCRVPWYILEKHHLTKRTKPIIMCPNCHALYERKIQRGKK